MIIPDFKKDNAILTSSDFTIGLRIPNSYITRNLIKETGPLLTSSANISGFKGAITAEGIALDFSKY